MVDKIVEPRKRVHIYVFEEDWNKLGTIYGDPVKRGNIMRMLLRDFIKRIEARAEQTQQQKVKAHDGLAID